MLLIINQPHIILETCQPLQYQQVLRCEVFTRRSYQNGSNTY